MSAYSLFYTYMKCEPVTGSFIENEHVPFDFEAAKAEVKDLIKKKGIVANDPFEIRNFDEEIELFFTHFWSLAQRAIFATEHSFNKSVINDFDRDLRKLKGLFDQNFENISELRFVKHVDKKNGKVEKCTIKIDSAVLLNGYLFPLLNRNEQLKKSIENIKESKVVYPNIKNKSSYYNNFIKSLYPFVLYLQEQTIPNFTTHKKDKYGDEFVVKITSWKTKSRIYEHFLEDFIIKLGVPLKKLHTAQYAKEYLKDTFKTIDKKK